MTHTSRFPHLAVPFSIIGAAAGWLSVKLLSNPMLRMLWPGTELAATVIAMLLAALTGVLLTRFCTGKRYAYELETPDTAAPPPSDTWPRHVSLVLTAGAATGFAISLLYDTFYGYLAGALGGLACAAGFVPVCVFVIIAARRAQRARMGSLVSDSDRRAVWGILATAMAVTTVLALPDWLASRVNEADRPLPAVIMVLCAGLVVALILVLDRRALRRIQASCTAALTQRNPDESKREETDVPRVDLGLGDGTWAHLSRSASAYRGRDRTLSLVQGSPEEAKGAIQRAIRRGWVSLALIGLVGGAHAVTTTAPLLLVYEERRCDLGSAEACTRVADALRSDSLAAAIVRYRQACAGSDPKGCLSAALIYDELDAEIGPLVLGEQIPLEVLRDETMRASDYFHRRACETGTFTSCRRGRWVRRR